MVNQADTHFDDSTNPTGVPTAPVPGADPAASESIASFKRPRAYTHRWYDLMFDEWEFLRQSHEGGAEYIESNLFRHPKEGLKYYQRRLQRAVYRNHVRAVARTFSAQLYKRPIARSGESDLLVDFWADIDMAGKTADGLYEEVCQWGQVYGELAVVVDRMEPAGAEIQTRAQELAAGRRPYAYWVAPQDIVDWQTDRNGNPAWVAVREYYEPERGYDQPYLGPEERIRIWTRDGWQLFTVEVSKDEREKRYTRIAAGQHPCGRVPIAWLWLGRRYGKELVAESPMKDIAPLSRRQMNLESLIDEEIYQHVFNILCVPPSTWDELEKIDFSVAGTIPFDDNEGQPFYLSTDVSQVEAIRHEVMYTEDAIRFLSGLGRQNEQSRAAQSGLALAYQNVDKKALMNQLAQSMAELELEVDKLALLWMGHDDGQAQLHEYKVELEPGEVEESLKEALKFQSLGLGGLPEIENAKLAAKARFNQTATPAEMHEIVDWIDANYQPIGLGAGISAPYERAEGLRTAQSANPGGGE